MSQNWVLPTAALDKAQRIYYSFATNSVYVTTTPINNNPKDDSKKSEDVRKQGPVLERGQLLLLEKDGHPRSALHFDQEFNRRMELDAKSPDHISKTDKEKAIGLINDLYRTTEDHAVFPIIPATAGVQLRRVANFAELIHQNLG